MRKITIVRILAATAVCAASCSPIQPLLDEITQAGYIPFQTPMEYAGPGTLIGGVGGKANELTFVAPPQTCFPDTLPDGTPTNLRVRDTTALPGQSSVTTVGFDANVSVLQGLSTANGSLQAGVSFNTVDKMEVSFEGVHVDYLDSVKLVSFYQQDMTADCKTWLEQVGFIVQAIEADQLSFKLYDKTGGSIALTADNLPNFINVSADLNFQIENDIELVITTPKYLGYQLGRFQKVDNGYAFYRAASTYADGTFDWQSITVFDSDN